MEFTEFDNYVKHSQTGSRYICDPPVEDTDDDYIVLTEDKACFLSESAANGWDVHSYDDYPEDDDFVSLRKGVVNLIVTECDVFYGRFVTATNAAKKMNLIDKTDRIKFFQGVLYGNLSA